MDRVVHDCVDERDGPVVGWMILCPACGNGHRFEVGRWSFNGDHQRPTFSPSMLVRVGPMPTVPVGRPDAGKVHVCHSFVENGQIRFLEDCTHELAGQTVPLEVW